MTVTAILDIHLKGESLDSSYRVVHDVLTDTRAFDGCLGVDVLIDAKDAAHLVLIERWESSDADRAYRKWRAGQGASQLADVLAGPPTRVLCTPAANI